MNDNKLNVIAGQIDGIIAPVVLELNPVDLWEMTTAHDESTVPAEQVTALV